jgi:hypothetical protein
MSRRACTRGPCCGGFEPWSRLPASSLAQTTTGEPMTRMSLARRRVALSVCLVSGLVGALADPPRSEAAGFAVPAVATHSAIVRAQAGAEGQKQRKKAAPKATAPGGQNSESGPKFTPRDEPMTGPQEPRPRSPQLARCPGPSPECPPPQM